MRVPVVGRTCHNPIVLTLRRARRRLAIVCVVAIAVAVFAPGVAALDLAPPPIEYVLLPQLEPLEPVAAAVVPVVQLTALRTALPERAPPVSL
jgi:hypothetical protein